MADLSPEESAVFEAVRDRISRMTGIPTSRIPALKVHSLQADARAAIAALDLPARDARVRAEVRASVAAEIAEALSPYIGTEANAETLAAVALEHAVAPEHTTPREKP